MSVRGAVSRVARIGGATAAGVALGLSVGNTFGTVHATVTPPIPDTSSSFVAAPHASSTQAQQSIVNLDRAYAGLQDAAGKVTSPGTDWQNDPGGALDYNYGRTVRVLNCGYSSKEASVLRQSINTTPTVASYDAAARSAKETVANCAELVMTELQSDPGVVISRIEADVVTLDHAARAGDDGLVQKAAADLEGQVGTIDAQRNNDNNHKAVTLTGFWGLSLLGLVGGITDSAFADLKRKSRVVL